jgi:hypothetical protein
MEARGHSGPIGPPTTGLLDPACPPLDRDDRVMRAASVVLVLVALAGCSSASSSPAWTAAPVEPTQSRPTDAGLAIDVYKSPTCDCCHEWEAYLRARGYTVRSVPTDDMAAVKQARGLPESTWSCHTAVIDGYVIEGHVPVEAIEDLLDERPAIDGIALPGMPPGSPGMPGAKVGLFEILTINDGEVGSFGSY